MAVENGHFDHHEFQFDKTEANLWIRMLHPSLFYRQNMQRLDHEIVFWPQSTVMIAHVIIIASQYHKLIMSTSD